jgi:hypothetical protein
LAEYIFILNSSTSTFAGRIIIQPKNFNARFMQNIQHMGLVKKNYPNGFVFYVSDHGESLGEKGVYLHSLPYIIAPKEQTHVPMLAKPEGNAYSILDHEIQENVIPPTHQIFDYQYKILNYQA